MMLHNPRDPRTTAVKIMHDYNLQPITPNIVRVYYDIETAVFGGQGVPQHQDRNAFITIIGMVVELPDGTVIKSALLNNQLRYTTETMD